MMGKAPTVHERSVSEDHWAVVPEGEGLFSGDAGRRVDMVQLLRQTRPLGRETIPEARCGRHDVGMIGRMSNEVYGAKKEESYASPITDRISSSQKENIASSGLRAHMSRSGRGVAKGREPIWPRGPARLRTPERQNTLGKDRLSAWTLARSELESNNTLNADSWRRDDGK